MEDKLKRLRIIKEHEYSHNAMSDALYELYSSRWNVFIENIQSKVESAMPFLIVPTNDYCISEKRIKRVLPNLFSRKFAKLQFCDREMPPSYRGYHPTYLRRSKNFDRYLDIINDIIKKYKYPGDQRYLRYGLKV